MITIGVLEIIYMIFSKTDMKSILFSHGDPYCLRKPVVMVNILVAPPLVFLNELFTHYRKDVCFLLKLNF
jgi:hypothetical protein